MQSSIVRKNLVAPKELASMLGLSIASIYRLIESRKILFYKIGWSIRFNLDDVDDYLNSARVNTIKL